MKLRPLLFTLAALLIAPSCVYEREGCRFDDFGDRVTEASDRDEFEDGEENSWRAASARVERRQVQASEAAVDRPAIEVEVEFEEEVEVETVVEHAVESATEHPAKPDLDARIAGLKERIRAGLATIKAKTKAKLN